MTHQNGIHHITAVTLDAQRNLDFYEAVLGQRLVKRTVNFDAPETYHLYYGDATGAPGTLLTFFAWPGSERGRAGHGTVGEVAFAVPPGTEARWRARLSEHGIPVREESRFNERVLCFEDPDGLPLALVATPEAPRPAEAADAEFAAVGLFGTTLHVAESGPTAELLERLGFARQAEANGRLRFRAAGHAPGRTLDLLEVAQRARPGAGTVHHLALRVPDEDALQRAQDELREARWSVTSVKDRHYFRSIYFRGPGGVLFELATDGPGFGHDESSDALGRRLTLPPWLEGRRAELEEALPPLRRHLA